MAIAPGLELAAGRVHEMCGLARRTLTLRAAAGTDGPVFWIAPSWTGGGLNPDGISHLVNPGRLIFVGPKRAEDLLWCFDEVLRSARCRWRWPTCRTRRG